MILALNRYNKGAQDRLDKLAEKMVSKRTAKKIKKLMGENAEEPEPEPKDEEPDDKGKKGGGPEGGDPEGGGGRPSETPVTAIVA